MEEDKAKAKAEKESSATDKTKKGVGTTSFYGVTVRNYKGSKRPPGIFPMEWVALTPKQKLAAIAKYAERRESKE
jgi:hypothetical protein